MPSGRVVRWNDGDVEFLHDLQSGRTFRHHNSQGASYSATETQAGNARDPFPNLERWMAPTFVDTPIFAYRGHIVVGPRIGISDGCATCVIVRLLAADPARRALVTAWTGKERHCSQWFGEAVDELGARGKALDLDDDGVDHGVFLRPFDGGVGWIRKTVNRLPGCPKHQLSPYSRSLGLR